MRRLFLATLLVIGLLTFALGQTKNQKSSSSRNKGGNVEQTLRQIEDDWARATINRDVSTIDRILAPDWVYTDADGNIMTKSEFITGLKSGAFKADTFTVDDMKMNVYGNAAVVRAKVAMKGSYQGQAIDEQDQSTDMFVKMGGRWQAVATQSSRISKR